MVTREKIIAEIENVPDTKLDDLYRIIRDLGAGSGESSDAAGEPSPDASVSASPQADVALDFERQKRAYLAIAGEGLARYEGQFVASRNGQIVDHDEDLPALTGRFFEQYGDVPVYITKVGERQRVLLRTPRPRPR